jgi:NAD(P)H-hydrate epimerase
MKIYTAKQIKQADKYTIKNEPISSVDLMERAANGAFNWINKKFNNKTVFSIFCGVGNNGGDGLVIARKLHKKGFSVLVYEVQFSSNYSEDYSTNKKRLEDLDISVFEVKPDSDLLSIEYGNVIIDCVFGSGLSKEIDEDQWIGVLISKLNKQLCTRISIDIASGLYCEDNDENEGVIFQPDFTLTFQFPKLAFLFPNNTKFVGEFTVIPIGLSKAFILKEPTQFFTIQKFTAQIIHKKSNKFDYKGTYGHGLVMAGSQGKMGAAVLAAKACLKSGAGLVTAHIPKSGNDIMQISAPEIMTSCDASSDNLTELKNVSVYSAIGIGPGIGKSLATQNLLGEVLKNSNVSIVLDADALNIISKNKTMLNSLPKGSIITPHVGEWKRLVGEANGDYSQLKSAINFANINDVIVVLKGAHTTVICPNGEVFFNLTGNPGMATAGSGDVLTGILTGLLSQGYEAIQAAILGVYIHGLAGDIALKKGSRESVTANDIINNLGKAFQKLNESKEHS